jgi:hypothetical protein
MRRKENGFEAIWEVDDGYAGGSAPQYTIINDDDLYPDMDDDEIRTLFDELIQESFNEKISWYSKSREDFVDWAHKRIEAMKEGAE